MTDELTLAGLGTAALTEGIKFLYAQAGEALKHHRERGDAQDGATSRTPEIVAWPRELQAPEPTALLRFEPELRALRAALAEYACDKDVVDPEDPGPVRTAEALRRVLEVIYGGVRLEFVGEPRTRPVIRGRIKALDVEGTVAAVLSNDLARAIEGEVDVRTVKRGAKVIGVDVRRGAEDRDRT